MYIKQGFAKNYLTVGIFFDLKKVYDTTWRYGILKDMHDMGLRGKLPQYVKQFSQIDLFKSQLTTNYLTPTPSKQEYHREAF